MGTRCGDLDPGVLAFLEREEKLSASKSEEVLNKKSGLLGLSGVSSDMREVLRAADQGHQRALIALKAYCYRVRKYIGAYVAAMGSELAAGSPFRQGDDCPAPDSKDRARETD